MGVHSGPRRSQVIFHHFWICNSFPLCNRNGLPLPKASTLYFENVGIPRSLILRFGVIRSRYLSEGTKVIASSYSYVRKRIGRSATAKR